MLKITRRVGESFFIGDDIKVVILGVKGHQVRVGISAPKDESVLREELYNRDQDPNNNDEDYPPAPG